MLSRRRLISKIPQILLLARFTNYELEGPLLRGEKTWGVVFLRVFSGYGPGGYPDEMIF
jgi:hypothetical protein